MIVDCHGHYTTAPPALRDWRKRQLSDAKNCSGALKVSDQEIRDSLEGAQLRIQRERGTDITFFSPRAGSMEHHVGDAAISLAWSRVCNDLIHRCCTLYPKNFVPVCQLPQSSGVSHLRLPPGGHRPAAQGDPGGQHPLRRRDRRRGARHRPGHYYDDTRRYEAWFSR